jgi:hypothetical protein
MSRILDLIGNRVISSALYDRSYGEVGHDFLTSTRVHENIITNPPCNSAEGFVRSGLTFYPLGAVRKGSGTMAYAWFVASVAPVRSERLKVD